MAKTNENGTCFVLMPFGGWFDVYYKDVLEPTISEANFNCKRADSLFRSSSIMGDIWKFVQESRVLLADMSGMNANVFYELGLAHAIGKPVVLITSNIDDIPFDLRSNRAIRYDKEDPFWAKKLQTQVASALAETLDDPVEAVPDIFRKVVPSQAPEQDEFHVQLDRLERIVMEQQRVLRGIMNPSPPIATGLASLGDSPFTDSGRNFYEPVIRGKYPGVDTTDT